MPVRVLPRERHRVRGRLKCSITPCLSRRAAPAVPVLAPYLCVAARLRACAPALLISRHRARDTIFGDVATQHTLTCDGRSGALLGKGVYCTTTLDKAMNYAKKKPASGIIFELRIDLGNCKTLEKDDPMMKTWQDNGYDSAWAPKGANNLGLEENCVKDPSRIQIVRAIAGHTGELLKMELGIRDDGKLVKLQDLQGGSCETITNKGICKACKKAVWSNQERYQHPDGTYLHKSCKETTTATCDVAGCSRVTWNGDFGGQCCRTCKSSGGAKHGPDCEAKAKGGAGGSVRLEGAGGDKGSLCNGVYDVSGTHNGKPLYVRKGGKAKIYFNDFWKVTHHGDTSGWVYGVQSDEGKGALPPTAWRNDGYSGSDASPCPTLHFLSPSTASPSALKVGDRVRVKRSVSDPKYGWGSVSHESSGTLTKIDEDGDVQIDFAFRKGWNGRLVEVEADDRAPTALKVGDRVRVKRSVASPKHGWGSVTHESSGTLKRIDDGGKVKIDFDCQAGWTGQLEEIEADDRAAVAKGVGCRVVLTNNYADFDDAKDGPLKPGLSERLLCPAGMCLIALWVWRVL